MTYIELTLLISGSVLLCFWLAILWRTRNADTWLPTLPTTDGVTGTGKASILVAVRNEEGRMLEEFLASLDEIEYPDFEVVIVDDHSDDGSLDRLEEQSRKASNLTVLRAGDHRKGKREALIQAADHADGEWLLFTDADVMLEPDALARGVAYCEREAVDGLSLVPKSLAVSFWEQATLVAGSWISFFGNVLKNCNDDQAPVGMAAAGPYILLRRKAYLGMGGYGAIKQNVLVDIALARRCREAGYRYRYLHSAGAVSTRMYSSAGEIWQGFSKNAFAAFGHSYPQAVAGLLAFLFATVMPAIGMVFAGALIVQGQTLGASFALAVYVMAFACMLWSQRRAAVWMGTRPDLAPLLLSPLGAAFWGAILCNSILRHRKGVRWKGRTIACTEDVP